MPDFGFRCYSNIDKASKRLFENRPRKIFRERCASADRRRRLKAPPDLAAEFSPIMGRIFGAFAEGAAGWAALVYGPGWLDRAHTSAGVIGFFAARFRRGRVPGWKDWRELSPSLARARDWTPARPRAVNPGH